MIVGEQYALETRRSSGPLKVTVLETPAEVRSQQRVRIRYEAGVSLGKVSDVPSRRIIRPWRGTVPRRRTARRRQPPLRAWPPSVGDSVLWAETGPVTWTIERIDGAEVDICSAIFGREQRHSVALKELTPAPAQEQEVLEGNPTAAAALARLASAETTPTGENEQDQPPLHPIPDSDDDESGDPLTRLLDRLVFSPHALGQYRGRNGRKPPLAEVPGLLRREIKRDGTLIRRWPGDREEYLRIRVPGRFDVVLEESPSQAGQVVVDRLTLSRRGKQGKGRRQRRRPEGKRRAA